MRKVALLVIMIFFVSVPAIPEVTDNERIAITRDVFIPCAAGGLGEVVSLGGSLHIVNRVTMNNNTLHFGTYHNPQGVRGQGLSTGDKYQGTGETHTEVNVSPLPEFPYVMTLTDNFRIIGQGTGNNFLLHETSHVTINAKGDVTTELDKLTIECK